MADFQTNRTGFCVLHPIENYSGRECIISDTIGKETSYRFPKNISPDQPMKNIREISSNIGNSETAKLIFEGETFETEDQRNWTDDLYKTYCRPLELPFPYMLKKGEKTFQRITVLVPDQAYSKKNYLTLQFYRQKLIRSSWRYFSGREGEKTG